MAIQMNFTDGFGENYPTAYFRVVQMNFSKENENALIIFYGFPDAVRAGKRIIGQKTYNIGKDKLAVYFQTAPVDVTTSLNACLSMAYQLAKETLDTNWGIKNLDGSAKMESFFKGGIDL